MVQQFLLDRLQSPTSNGPLYERSSNAGSARFVGEQGEEYPVRGNIPRFVSDEQFTESFGFQWNRFDVRQLGEDEETFELKTGVRLDELQELVVLDAGCGGGRYSRVAGEHGAQVVAVDLSSAVEKARELTSGLDNVAVIQSDLTSLPLKPASFDLVFSIGVLHHSPDTKTAFDSIARMVKPGGRLSVWLYRRNTWPQERLNDLLRWVARKLPRRALLLGCQAAAFLGGIPILNRTLNKIANFSNHPSWVNRVCDNFDWYSPQYQHHHTVEEVWRWFEGAGFGEIRELPPAKNGTLYTVAFRLGLIIGSGVNLTGVKISSAK